MKTRQQIIAENLQLYQRQCGKSDRGDYYKNLAEEQGQEYVDKLLAERQNYSSVIKAELAKRLTDEAYLTCEDFDHFDIACCETCHTCYPPTRCGSSYLVTVGTHGYVTRSKRF